MDKRQLKELIEKEKSKGTSVSLIRDKLVAKGYPKDIIDDVLDLKVPGFSVSKIKLLALWCGIFAIIITMFFVFLNVPISKVPVNIDTNKTTTDTGCGNLDPDICYFRRAIELNDKSFCSKITNEFLNGLCYGDMRTTDCIYYSVAQYPESRMSDCFINQATESNNFSLCRSVGRTKDCLDAMYSKNGAKISCDGNLVCSAYIAEKSGDYSSCSSKDQCYLANSITFNDPELCRSVADDNVRRNCIYYFADASKDIKYCFMNSVDIDAINCISSVYVPDSEISSDNRLKITGLVERKCQSEMDSMEDSQCRIKYALIFRMPFICNSIQDSAVSAQCSGIFTGKTEIPLSACETFKNPNAQNGCKAALEKCNALEPDARLECLRSL